MKSYKTEAVILKRTSLGEADRIITLFSRDYGKITAVAKGVRKITSKRSAHLELFTHIRVQLVEWKTMDIITEVAPQQTFPSLRQNYAKMTTAFWIIEEIERLCGEHQEHEQIFALLIKALSYLNGHQLDHSHNTKIRDRFSTVLLQELGYLPAEKVFTGDELYQFIISILESELRSKKLQLSC